jgi:steroid delta-isomerase-like uncharacterized protein
MSPQEHKALVQRFVDEAQTKGNLDAVDEFLAKSFIDHSALPGFSPDRDGVKQLFAVFRTAFPDFRAVIHDQIAEGDKVVTRKTFHGTHQGEFFGIPATGKQVTIEVIDIVQFGNGKIIDHWNVVNQLGLMQQLGVIAGR